MLPVHYYTGNVPDATHAILLQLLAAGADRMPRQVAASEVEVAGTDHICCGRCWRPDHAAAAQKPSQGPGHTSALRGRLRCAKHSQGCPDTLLSEDALKEPARQNARHGRRLPQEADAACSVCLSRVRLQTAAQKCPCDNFLMALLKARSKVPSGPRAQHSCKAGGMSVVRWHVGSTPQCSTSACRLTWRLPGVRI